MTNSRPSARCANGLRRSVNGEVISYVVTRNINYTNICSFKCQFCAFSKGKMSENLRGRPYDIGMDEVERRVQEAWERGATEVCMQGGIHPYYTGQKYLDICGCGARRGARDACPRLLAAGGAWQGAATLGTAVAEFLGDLKEAGLGIAAGDGSGNARRRSARVTLPRQDQYRRVARCHARARIVWACSTTATIMFGHVEGYDHWARHLIRLRDLQAETGGFTEFVPLPFVHMEAPIYLKGTVAAWPDFPRG